MKKKIPTLTLDEKRHAEIEAFIDETYRDSAWVIDNISQDGDIWRVKVFMSEEYYGESSCFDPCQFSISVVTHVPVFAPSSHDTRDVYCEHADLRAFAGACKDAGIVDLHWHDLRHTFGTRMAEAGYSEATIAELMGHCDAKTTRRYTHATDRGKRAAVESVRLIAGGTCPKYAPKQEQPPKLAAVNG